MYPSRGRLPCWERRSSGWRLFAVASGCDRRIAVKPVSGSAPRPAPRRLAPEHRSPRGVVVADPWDRAARWLAAWDSHGNHRTATDGDNAGAEWLADEA